jgi:hypothetical protein
MFRIVTAIRYLIIILGLEFGPHTAYACWRAIDALAIGGTYRIRQSPVDKDKKELLDS